MSKKRKLTEQECYEAMKRCVFNFAVNVEVMAVQEEIPHREALRRVLANGQHDVQMFEHVATVTAQMNSMFKRMSNRNGTDELPVEGRR